MSFDPSLSPSRVAGLSPTLRAQADAYARARSEHGVDDQSFNVAGARAALEKSTGNRETEGRFRTQTLVGLPVHVAPGGAPTLVYFHGGGFVGGSVRSHGHISLALGDGLGSRVVFPDYRLAPEHRFPAAFDDADAVLSSLHGRGPLVVAGDSVGAAIALHLALFHPDRDRIAALALLAPMLAFDAGTSPYLRTHGRARSMIAQSICAQQLADRRLTPLDQDLSVLPPMLIQIGGADYVKDDGLLLAAKAAQGGAPVVLEHWPNMPHVWHRYAPEAPEAARALKRAATFLADHSNPDSGRQRHDSSEDTL